MFGRLTIPSRRLGTILRYAQYAKRVQVGETDLGLNVSLISCLLDPREALDRVVNWLTSKYVHFAKTTLSTRVALLRSLTIPKNRLSLVLGHALPVSVQLAKARLRFSVSLFGKRTPQAQRYCVIPLLISRKPIFNGTGKSSSRCR